ncbi:glycosyltransferase family A protein [Acidisphaera sp. S103]|uniref:glycosyltransferase family A protein n=1 Tax=Acidisphaera sp. S103 TaxID=1747223 RepID=UPI00131CBE96|nr:glycosyltransferase family A protein [Acidisphaera sp. S103]
MEIGFDRDRCRVSEIDCPRSLHEVDDVLSVIVLFDTPFDLTSLDEALFSIAAQDHEYLDVILVTPDLGSSHLARLEEVAKLQPWPDHTTIRVVSVPAAVSRSISPCLVNAGLRRAAGRYVALLHHQNLIYQHSYTAFINSLQATSAPVAFGGVRVAWHAYGNRHWLVTDKSDPVFHLSRLEFVLGGSAAVDSFVADRRRLGPDCLIADQPESVLSIPMFLLRLAMHSDADFSLAEKKIVEVRVPPNVQTINGLQRLPSLESVLAVLGQAVIRPDALSAAELLREVIKTRSSRLP